MKKVILILIPLLMILLPIITNMVLNIYNLELNNIIYYVISIILLIYLIILSILFINKKITLVFILPSMLILYSIIIFGMLAFIGIDKKKDNNYIYTYYPLSLKQDNVCYKYKNIIIKDKTKHTCEI